MPTDVTLSLNPYEMAVWAVVGLIAGFLASRLVLKDGMGIVRELVVGVIGGVLGNLVFGYLHVTISVVGYPILSQIIVAFFGALALVLVLRLAGLGRGHERWERPLDQNAESRRAPR